MNNSATAELQLDANDSDVELMLRRKRVTTPRFRSCLSDTRSGS